MATYAIGDLQGCYEAFIALLKKLNFNWDKDKLWLCGDLINRGPQSLNTLRYIYEHRERIKVVLGNHDLHMLAVATGAQSIKKKDTFQSIIERPENQDLIDWLYQQPLAHYSKKRKTLMVHAGVPAQWSIDEVLQHAKEVSKVLKKPNKREKFFKAMYGNEPSQWDSNLTGKARLRYITNALTRMRFCYRDGRLELGYKSAPDDRPDNLIPWYEQALKLEPDIRVVFGHWAALEGKLATDRFQALDTGCVWGGPLTALNLKTNERTCVRV